MLPVNRLLVLACALVVPPASASLPAMAPAGSPPVARVTQPLSFTLTQGGTTQPVQAVERAESGASFYDYFSASSHTGFERAYESKLFLYRDTTTGALSLFITHGIDRDTSGISTTDGAATFDLAGVPAGAFVAQSDDPGGPGGGELNLAANPEGRWNWRDNTDGGVIDGLPTDSPWCITITPLGFFSITSWIYHFASGAAIDLDMTQPVTICFEAPVDVNVLDIDEGQEASVSGSFDDPDVADTHVVTWDFGEGTTAPGTYWPGVGFTHHDVDPAFHVYGDDGDFIATLGVTDSEGLTGADTVTVHVHNVAPSVTLAVPPGSVGFTFNMSAIGRDPGSDDLWFDWDFGDGSPRVLSGHLNNDPLADPLPSPGGMFPFLANDPQTHLYCEPGTYTVTVTVTDDDGGVTTATALAVVAPTPVGTECNEPPACEAGPDVAASCDGVRLAGAATDPDGDPLLISWTSSCPGAVFSPGPDVLDPIVTFGASCGVDCTLTLRVDDGQGGTCTDALRVTVSDVEPPTLIGMLPDSTHACLAPPPAVVTATDGCDPSPVVTFAEQRLDGPCVDTYQLRRTWTARDACGNAVSQVQVVSVQDVVPPVLSGVPADVTVACSALPPVPTSVTAADACDPSPVVTFAEERLDGPCADTYQLRRTWTARDRCLNAASSTQVITVQDLVPPVLSGVPADVTVECTAVPPVPASVTASDACDPSPGLAFSEVRRDGRCAGEYVLSRTWTARDRCLNVASRTQVITVQDTTPPVVEAGSGGSACLWPPNHRMVRYDAGDFAPRIADACSEPATWRFVGCASDQPDDARETDAASPFNGDGHFPGDCEVAPDGSWFAVRAERAGTGPTAAEGRHYSVAIVATDACGNESAATVIGTVLVPHDRSAHEEGCRPARRR